MSKAELSKDEIDRLFRFVASKYVRYIDVQHELVDHLASAIEDEMDKDNSLTFDQALKLVYGRFPVTGFSNFVSTKEREMRRYWNLRTLSYLKQFLTFPKCVLTVMIFSIITTMTYLIGKIFLMSLTFVLIVFVLYYVWAERATFRHIDKEKYLFLNSFTGTLSSYVPVLNTLFLAIHLTRIKYDLTFTPIPIIICVFYAFVTIWCYASVYVFPEMLREEINKKYQHIVVN